MNVCIRTSQGDAFIFPHKDYPADMAQLRAIMAANYPDATVARMDLK
jgi:hypothetical protein